MNAAVSKSKSATNQRRYRARQKASALIEGYLEKSEIDKDGYYHPLVFVEIMEAQASHELSAYVKYQSDRINEFYEVLMEYEPSSEDTEMYHIVDMVLSWMDSEKQED